MQDLKSLLQKSVQRAGITRQLDATRTVEIAEEVLREFLPASLASKTRPLYLRNKSLAIACLSSIAAQEIKFQETDIIAAINKKMGFNAVEKIRYAG